MSISTIGSSGKGISIVRRSIGNSGRSISISWKGISISVAGGSISTIERSEDCGAVIHGLSAAHTQIPDLLYISKTIKFKNNYLIIKSFLQWKKVLKLMSQWS